MTFAYETQPRTMSSSIEPRALVSMCETNLNDKFKPSFRDNRDRNSQQETTSLPTRWNKTKKQNRDASRVVCKTFREDMSYPASARNIPNNNVRLPEGLWQSDDIDITYHQTHMPIQPRHEPSHFVASQRSAKMAPKRSFLQRRVSLPHRQNISETGKKADTHSERRRGERQRERHTKEKGVCQVH